MKRLYYNQVQNYKHADVIVRLKREVFNKVIH